MRTDSWCGDLCVTRQGSGQVGVSCLFHELPAKHVPSSGDLAGPVSIPGGLTPSQGVGLTALDLQTPNTSFCLGIFSLVTVTPQVLVFFWGGAGTECSRNGGDLGFRDCPAEGAPYDPVLTRPGILVEQRPQHRMWGRHCDSTEDKDPIASICVPWGLPLAPIPGRPFVKMY